MVVQDDEDDHDNTTNNKNKNKKLVLDLQYCLQKLEKRIQKGPVSLNKDEVWNEDATLEQIVQNMNYIQQEQQQQQLLSTQLIRF